MKPKILFIMHTPPPVHGASMVGSYIRDSELVNDTFDCYFMKPSNTKSLTELGKFSLYKFLFFISFHYRLIKTYRKIKPDICYFTPSSWNFAFYRDFITVFILKLLKADIVVHFHNKPKASFVKKWYNEYIYRNFFKRLNVIFLAEQLILEFRQHFDSKMIYICPNGIPETISQPIERNHTHAVFSFLFLSNMMAKKGVWTLLESCSIIKKRGYTFTCNFVGQWSDISASEFAEKVIKYGLTNEIQAHGAKYNDEKNIFFQSADTFVFPSFDEAFSLVLLEAMEFSLSCISTYVGGIPSIIKDGQSGFIVPSKNAEKMAEKMIYLIENPQKSIEMGKTGRMLFEKQYTLRTFEQNFVDILKAIYQNHTNAHS